MIAERIKLIREQRGLSQTQAAEQLGLSRVNYNRYENGEREPDNETIKKIAAFFDVTTDYLLGISNERNPGSGVQNIDDPEVRKLMETVTAEFRMSPEVPEKAKQEILREMANYFKYKLEQEKRSK